MAKIAELDQKVLAISDCVSTLEALDFQREELEKQAKTGTVVSGDTNWGYPVTDEESIFLSSSLSSLSFFLSSEKID